MYLMTWFAFLFAFALAFRHFYWSWRKVVVLANRRNGTTREIQIPVRLRTVSVVSGVLLLFVGLNLVAGHYPVALVLSVFSWAVTFMSQVGDAPDASEHMYPLTFFGSLFLAVASFLAMMPA